MFENATNGDLDKLIKKCKNRLPEHVVKLLFAQLINYNEYMQKQGVMHRDLKPLNIMLDKNYNVKVIDFGDARKVNEELDEEEDDAEGAPNMLRRGTFVGTVNYQSPEVINEDEQGLPIDTWALGNILFKMLTGHVPFKGSVAPTVYKDIKNRNI